MERLARLVENLECRINFHGRQDTLALVKEFFQNNHPSTRTEYTPMAHWDELPELASTVNEDHMLVVVTARKGTISYKNALERLPEEINNFFKGKTLMIIFPDQYGDSKETMTFATSQHTEERSAYGVLSAWLHKKLRR